MSISLIRTIASSLGGASAGCTGAKDRFIQKRPRYVGQFVLFALLASSPLPGATLEAVPGEPAAPEFVLSDLEGKRRTLGEFRGTVVLAFKIDIFA